MGTTTVKKTSTCTSEKVEQETRTTDVENACYGETSGCEFSTRSLHDDDDERACSEAERADALYTCDDVQEPENPIAHMGSKTLGRKGEESAVRYLERRGYDIAARNWKCRFGEADIIAYDQDGTLCFIEVKTRRSIDAGIPEESVTAEKQRKYEKIALSYLLEHETADGMPVRFDAIGICVNANGRALLRHHKGCFDGID